MFKLGMLCCFIGFALFAMSGGTCTATGEKMIHIGGYFFMVGILLALFSVFVLLLKVLP